MTTARAPLRISFAGGGTDVDAFSHKYGGCVVSATITRYATMRTSNQFISYPIDETEVDFLKAISQACNRVDKCLESRLDAPPRSGLGASGALAVAGVACLLGDTKTLALPTLAHKVNSILNIAAGRQDEFAATFGGFNKFKFSERESQVIALHPGREFILELESSIILCFVHSRVGSSTRIINEEISGVLQGDPHTIHTLLQQKDMAEGATRAIQESDIELLAKYMDLSWRLKKQLTPSVTNTVIDAVYELALRSGALGGKLCGAGGGGYLALLCPNKVGPVCEALRTIGLKPENVTFNWQGVEVW